MRPCRLACVPACTYECHAHVQVPCLAKKNHQITAHRCIQVIGIDPPHAWDLHEEGMPGMHIR